MRKFWNFIESEDGENVLRLDGEIASESWWGDEVTPKMFMGELANCTGKDITVWINSPGGDVVAGSQIYTALKEHKGQVTVKVDGIAASAASVIAMAGDFVYMAPTSMLMIHDPMTFAGGNEDVFQQCIDVLRECKESIINAYALKTGLSRAKLSRLMTDETWMNARKAVELGFADKILYTEKEPEMGNVLDSYLFGRRTVFNSLLAKLPKMQEEQPQAEEPEEESPVIEPIEEEPIDNDKSFLEEIENLKIEFEII